MWCSSNWQWGETSLWFALEFPYWQVILSTCVCCPFVFVPWKLLVPLLYHFLIGLFVGLLLSILRSLQILDIKSLSALEFANIFYYFVGCLLILRSVPLQCRSSLAWCSPICFYLPVFLGSFPSSLCSHLCLAGCPHVLLYNLMVSSHNFHLWFISNWCLYMVFGRYFIL